METNPTNYRVNKGSLSEHQQWNRGMGVKGCGHSEKCAVCGLDMMSLSSL